MDPLASRQDSKPKKKPRLNATEKKTVADKERFLEQLAKTPIVMAVAQATRTGRSTYYSWRLKDKGFASNADKALAEGRETVNDIAFSKLLELISQGNITSIIFWLKNNHVWFSEKVWHQHMHEHKLQSRTELPPEQREELLRALALSGRLGTIALSKQWEKEFLDSVPKPMTEEERIVDWGKTETRERFEKEAEREKSVNIERLLKKIQRN